MWISRLGNVVTLGRIQPSSVAASVTAALNILNNEATRPLSAHLVINLHSFKTQQRRNSAASQVPLDSPQQAVSMLLSHATEVVYGFVMDFVVNLTSHPWSVGYKQAVVSQQAKGMAWAGLAGGQ
jgi:hypothetical protein